MAATLTVCSGDTSLQTGTSSSIGETTGDTVTLKLVFQGGTDLVELKKVQGATNAATVPAINAKVELIRISHGTLNDQLSLILSSDEEMGLVNLRQLNATTLTSNGAIHPLTQLL